MSNLPEEPKIQPCSICGRELFYSTTTANVCPDCSTIGKSYNQPKLPEEPKLDGEVITSNDK